jgi:hypothetical protein
VIEDRLQDLALSRLRGAGHGAPACGNRKPSECLEDAKVRFSRAGLVDAVDGGSLLIAGTF